MKSPFLPFTTKQDIPWLIPRMVSFATDTLVMKQYNTNEHNGNEVTHIDITQIATGGVVTTESRILDWTLRDHKDHVFGDVKLKSRWVNLKNAKEDRNDDDENVEVDEFLKRGWDDDLDGEHVQTWGESEKKGWIANQVCGALYYFVVHLLRIPIYTSSPLLKLQLRHHSIH